MCCWLSCTFTHRCTNSWRRAELVCPKAVRRSTPAPWSRKLRRVMFANSAEGDEGCIRRFIDASYCRSLLNPPSSLGLGVFFIFLFSRRKLMQSQFHFDLEALLDTRNHISLWQLHTGMVQAICWFRHTCLLRVVWWGWLGWIIAWGNHVKINI